MKVKIIFGFLAICSLLAFTPVIKSGKAFQAGENYSYRVKYGFLTIGAADVNVEDRTYVVSGMPCYKVNVLGKTDGVASLFRVRNRYTSYFDTLNFLPRKFEYSARENNYKRDQTLFFDQRKNTVVKLEKDTRETYSVPKNIHDVISGYYSLRHVDFSNFRIGQKYTAPLFFDDEKYRFDVVYAGQSSIKTRFGRIDALKLNPVLPNNKLFQGEDAIRIWVSDDDNRVPLKIEVDFSFGTIVMEIKGYNNNLYPFSWI